MLLYACSACVTPSSPLEKLAVYLYDMALYNPLSIIVSPNYLYLFSKTFSYKFANFSHSKEKEEVSHTMSKNNREAKEKRDNLNH